MNPRKNISTSSQLSEFVTYCRSNPYLSKHSSPSPTGMGRLFYALHTLHFRSESSNAKQFLLELGNFTEHHLDSPFLKIDDIVYVFRIWKRSKDMFLTLNGIAAKLRFTIPNQVWITILSMYNFNDATGGKKAQIAIKTLKQAYKEGLNLEQLNLEMLKFHELIVDRIESDKQRNYRADLLALLLVKSCTENWPMELRPQTIVSHFNHKLNPNLDVKKALHLYGKLSVGDLIAFQGKALDSLILTFDKQPELVENMLKVAKPEMNLQQRVHLLFGLDFKIPGLVVQHMFFNNDNVFWEFCSEVLEGKKFKDIESFPIPIQFTKNLVARLYAYPHESKALISATIEIALGLKGLPPELCDRFARRFFQFQFASVYIETIPALYFRNLSMSEIQNAWDYLKHLSQRGLPLPNIKRMDLNAFWEDVLAWEARAHNQLRYSVRLLPVPSRFKPFQKATENQTVLEIRPIKTMRELIFEGKILEHCVGTYADSVVQRRTCIFSFRSIGTDPSKRTTIHRILTIQVIDSEVVQVRGLRNRNMDLEEFSTIKEWADRFKLKANYQELVA